MVEQKTPIKTKLLVPPPLSPAPHLWTSTQPRTPSASKTVPPPLTPAPYSRKPAPSNEIINNSQVDPRVDLLEKMNIRTSIQTLKGEL